MRSWSYLVATRSPPDLSTLETNMREAILAYLGDSDPDEPLPDFVGTWRVEVSA